MRPKSGLGLEMDSDGRTLRRSIRCLYVGLNAVYMNPTSSLLPSMLEEVADVTYFGPGYSTIEVLEKGLESFIQRHGPFDFGFTNELVVFAPLIKLDDKGLARRILITKQCRFGIKEAMKVRQLSAEWSKLALPRVVSVLEHDGYTWDSHYVDRIQEAADLVLGRGPENSLPIAEMNELGHEPWGDRATDHYINLVRSRPELFASFPLFVSEHEFNFSPIVMRSRNWAVPGIEYRQRHLAKKELRNLGYRFKRRPVSSYIYKFSEVIGRLPPESVTMGQRLFRRELRGTKVAFTCGSPLRMPIRKFFEIPAAGAMLACQPCQGLADYGFVDGVNCLYVDGSDIAQLDHLVQDDLERVQRIASNAQALVAASHSSQSRSGQFRAILEPFLAGKFAGARWQDGAYLIGGAQLRSNDS